MSDTAERLGTYEAWISTLTADGLWHKAAGWAGQLVVVAAWPKHKYGTCTANYRGRFLGPVHSEHGDDLAVLDISDPADSQLGPILLALKLDNISSIRAWDPSGDDGVAGVERQSAR